MLVWELEGINVHIRTFIRYEHKSRSQIEKHPATNILNVRPCSVQRTYTRQSRRKYIAGCLPERAPDRLIDIYECGRLLAECDLIFIFLYCG